jgi:dTDP-4-amino-4,6-dideoxygalactose transaminase
MQVPIMVPSLPRTEHLVDYLRRIDDTHIYSNYGPLYFEFKAELESYIRNSTRERPHATLCNNGTVAIELALRARLDEVKGGLCLMPSYTFIATAHAVNNVGLQPYFVDICPKSFALTPEIAHASLSSLPQRPEAVVVVSPFGQTVDIRAWERFEYETNIPVVLDLAAGITGIRHIGHQPVCLSLHATKILGIGEGGAVLSTNRDLTDRIHAMTGFGFSAGSRTSLIRGGNYRISEYAAAIGLASLGQLQRRIEALQGVFDLYRAAAKDCPVGFQDGFGAEWIAMTLNIFLKHENIDEVLSRFDEAGVQWRRWWSLGCHHHPAFSECGRGELDVTDYVGKRLIGVPFHESLTETQVNLVTSCL